LPLLLVRRNLTQITVTNGPWLRQFAGNLYTDLPAGKSVVLSEDPAELLLLRAELSGKPSEKEPLLLDAPSLSSAQYQEWTTRHFKSRWPVGSAGTSPGKVLELVCDLAAHEAVIYLHPSFGILFELLSDRPKGCISELAPRTRQQSPLDNHPPLRPEGQRQGQGAEVGDTPGFTREIAALNEQLWQQRWTESLQTLAAHTKEEPKYPPGFARGLRKRLYLASQPNFTMSFVGAAYSRRLNDWAVRMQRLGRDPEAAVWFGRTLQLNPENLTARISLQFAERCRSGDKSRLKVASVQNEFSELFANYDSWREILKANGPVDEPSFLFRTGRVLLAGGNYRQAIAEFGRAEELAPDWPAPKLLLAQSYIELRDFSRALEVTDRSQASSPPQDGPGLARLLECRATALRGLGRTNEAAACIEVFLTQPRKHTEVLSVAAGLYSQTAQFEKEVALLEEMLNREPNRPDLLCRKGLAQMQLGRYDAAVATLTSALGIAPRNENARLLRAVACLGANQLEAARADYQELVGTVSNGRNALFGLGTVAWRKQDTNLAVRYYEQFLSNGVGQTRQDKLALERLKQMQPGKVLKR